MSSGQTARRSVSGVDPLATKMRRVRLDVLYDQLAQGLFATLVNALILTYIQAPLVGYWQAWLWFCAMTVVSGARAVTLVFRHRLDGRTTNTDLWANLFFAGVLKRMPLGGGVCCIIPT